MPLLASAMLLAPIPSDLAPLSQSSLATAPPPEQSVPDAADQSQPDKADPAANDSETSKDEIVVTARQRGAPGDPFEGVNAKAFEATQTVDRAVVGPVALAYKHAMPEPVRDGLRNFLRNLQEPVVFLNFLLQLKPGKAAETFGRFTVNTTIGGAGLFDVARKRPFNLPRRPNGFAYTMGYYGVRSGAYLFLPLIGPTTTRDLIGGALDRLILPLSIGGPFSQTAYTLPAGALSVVDRRSEFDGTLKSLRDGHADPYRARREFYLQKRQNEIDELRGKRRPDTGMIQNQFDSPIAR